MGVKFISRLLTVISVAFFLPSVNFYARAQMKDSVEFLITFESDSTAIDLNYGGNGGVVDAFAEEWNALNSDSTVVISGIKLMGNASRDGWYARNCRIAKKRVANTARLLTGRFAVSSDLISTSIHPWWGDQKKRKEKPVLVVTVPNPLERSCKVTVEYSRPESFPSASPAGDTLERNVAILPVPAPSIPVAVGYEIPAVRGELAPVSRSAGENPLREVWRVKTNLLYDVATVANLSIEYGFCKHWAVELLATFSPWDIKYNFKIRTLLLQPEVRYYLKKGFTGHYFGLEGHFGWYNVAFPGGSTRYQDRDGNTPLWGAGLLYGYVLPFSRHWGMDFNIGVGYARLDYDCFYNVVNGARYTSSTRDWIGPTKLGVTIFYQF